MLSELHYCYPKRNVVVWNILMKIVKNFVYIIVYPCKSTTKLRRTENINESTWFTQTHENHNEREGK